MPRFQFLSQTLDIQSSQINQPDMSPNGFSTSILFHFMISTRLPAPDYRSPEHCLQLPPSIELGSVMVDNETRNRFAQPSISYAVRALITFVGRDDDATIPVEASVPIILMSHTKEFPPTDTVDFPAEFKLQESKSIKWSLFGRSLGNLVISMQEPRPVTYDATALAGFTECRLALELLPSGYEDVVPALQNMRITIHSLVRTKTFYSVKSFPRLPSQTLLSDDGKTRMRDEVLKLEKREISHVAWGYKYSSVGSVSVENESAEDLHLKKSTSISSQSEILQAPDGKWTASCNHSIRINGRLLPTFCSSLVARLYTIIVRVKVSGIRKEFFDLEVPLQVVHTSPRAMLDNDNNLVGPTEECNTSLDFRRASTTSWFSEESLVSRILINPFPSCILTLLRGIRTSLLTIILEALCRC
jgi:hypothetical protein